MDGWTYDSVELPGLAHQLLLEPAVLLKLRWRGRGRMDEEVRDIGRGEKQSWAKGGGR